MESYTEVFTWGSNSYGQMGLESSAISSPLPRICSFNILITQVSCGSEHSAFLSTQHFIYAMGSNSDGRLGVGDKSIACSSYPLLIEALVQYKTVQVSCGGAHTAAVTHNGEIFTWGKGAALGHGDLYTKWTPVKLSLDFTYVVQVSCGENHSGLIGIQNKEKVCLTWGAGDFGQLGTGTKESLNVPEKTLINDVKEVSCGDDFTLFLNVHGEVFSVGKNNHGQLGNGTVKDCCIPSKVKGMEQDFVMKISAGGMSGCVAEDGGLYVWGFNRLVPGLIRGAPRDIVDVCIGKNFGTCITRTSALWTWGDNLHGQLGIGDFNEKDGICVVNSLHKKKIKTAACGKDFIIVLGEDFKEKSRGKSAKAEKTPEKQQSKEQFWSSERNEISETVKNNKDITLYENALKKLNKLLVQKEKQLKHEKEYRVKNEGYQKIYLDLESQLASVINTIELEKQKREEIELSHTKKETRLLFVLRDREDEIQKLKNDNVNLRRLLETRPPCTTCVNLLEEFNSLKEKNEILISQLSKHSSSKSVKKIINFSPDTSGNYIPQSPSFDKSLDKSLDRHKSINNHLKFSRSESELLKLIETPMPSKSPKKTDRSKEKIIPRLKLDCEVQEDYVLPTFRNQENSFSMQKNIKSSLAEIKARILALNSNRSDLENKMEELELKLSHEPTFV